MNKTTACEINFDGIVGPTHNYGGLSFGNLASHKHRFLISNPREAALQGLEKMKFLAAKGIGQAVLPPHERPFLPILKKLGFSGDPHEIIQKAAVQCPELFLAISSAAAMWTANAATISPSIDAADHRIHLTPANLSSKFHRSIEAETTSAILKEIFHSPAHFNHHDPLHGNAFFSDEGAANHMRFCRAHGNPGVQLFVFGRYAFQEDRHPALVYPARQTSEASQAIARLHALDPQKVIFAQQHPNAINAGAFHNDVVAVGNENVFFFHEQAFWKKNKLLSELQEVMERECQADAVFLEVKSKDLSLEDAVSSYLFNSQLITLPNQSMILIAPMECQENPSIKNYIDGFIASPDNPIKEVFYTNLRQSMQNGGGPACLRIRLVMTKEEIQATHPGIFLKEELYL